MPQMDYFFGFTLEPRTRQRDKSRCRRAVPWRAGSELVTPQAEGCTDTLNERVEHSLWISSFSQ
jgi:hypothetical protein